MGARVEIDVLGALQVRSDGVEVLVPGGRCAVVVASLALSAGRVVSRGTLAEQVWGDGEQPQSVRASGDRSGESDVRNDFGDSLRTLGRLDDAREQYELALELAVERSDQRAHAHVGMAWTLRDADVGAAVWHRRQALAIHTAQGAPEADEIRALLEELSGLPSNE